MFHISIIIVDYNGEKDTRECLLSLKKIQHSSFTFSTIVIDNGSKEILSIPAKHMPENSVILRSDANLGFTNGNNLGVNYAISKYNPDYILLLNNDTLVTPDFLEKLVECAQRNEDAGIITPKIYFSPGREFHSESYTAEEQGKVFWYAGGSIDWKNLDAFHRGVDEVDRDQFDRQKESDFSTGCCALLPRKVVNQVKLFDPGYFLYLEDVDLSMRIKLAGYKVLFCPETHIWHKNAGSTGGAGSALQQYYQTRNRLFFFLKYGKWKVKLTTVRFGLQLLFMGSEVERRATWDWIIGKMGKQAIL